MEKSKVSRNLLRKENWPVLVGLLIILVWIVAVWSDNTTGRLIGLAESLPAFLLLALGIFVLKKVVGMVKKKK